MSQFLHSPPNQLLAPPTAGPSSLEPKTKAPAKLRRSRQPRNPQLSVARRNERERNRVKMVNNGFALLREHLPAADLHACDTGSGSESPDAPGSATGRHAGKARKFSKVETLRAAIKRIRMLEELIRATEPGFQSMQLSSGYQLDDACDDAAGSNSCSSQAPALYLAEQSQQQQQQQQQQPMQPVDQQHQFVRLAGAASAAQQQPRATTSGRLTSSTSSNSASPLSNPYNHHSQLATQVHNNNNNHLSHHTHQQPQEAPSHTHLWIQQHQSSFMEQQWYQANLNQAATPHNNHCLHDTAGPMQPPPLSDGHGSPWSYASATGPAHLEASPSSGSEQVALAGQLAPESPVWLNSSPVQQHQQQLQQQQSASQPATFHQPLHQISLYSQ